MEYSRHFDLFCLYSCHSGYVQLDAPSAVCELNSPSVALFVIHKSVSELIKNFKNSVHCLSWGSLYQYPVRKYHGDVCQEILSVYLIANIFVVNISCYSEAVFAITQSSQYIF